MNLRNRIATAIALPKWATPVDKPWRNAPDTDAIWQRHTSDAAAALEEERTGKESLTHYYEMASHACALERDRNALLLVIGELAEALKAIKTGRGWASKAEDALALLERKEWKP